MAGSWPSPVPATGRPAAPHLQPLDWSGVCWEMEVETHKLSGSWNRHPQHPGCPVPHPKLGVSKGPILRPDKIVQLLGLPRSFGRQRCKDPTRISRQAPSRPFQGTVISRNFISGSWEKKTRLPFPVDPSCHYGTQPFVFGLLRVDPVCPFSFWSLVPSEKKELGLLLISLI